MKTPQPITLAGRYVMLRPLLETDIPELCQIGLEESLWRLSSSKVSTPEDMAAYVRAALSAQQNNSAVPFVLVEPASHRLIGSTRYGNIDVANGSLEIGWTWINPAWQRTGVNTEAKYLLLRHAFEELDCIRVSLKTDVLNQRSRQAMLRIGAKEEGILRNHMITSEGRIRDTVMLSIIAQEWPQVKQRLEILLQRAVIA